MISSHLANTLMNSIDKHTIQTVGQEKSKVITHTENRNLKRCNPFSWHVPSFFPDCSGLWSRSGSRGEREDKGLDF